MAAQDLSIAIFAHGMWPQGDARDPLGVWGGRHIATATVGDGPIKVRFQAAATIAGAYVYTCYSANIAGLTVATLGIGKCRLLTNWPDVDDDIGVQGYGSVKMVQVDGSSGFTPPFTGALIGGALVQPSDRFILLFDPRPVVGAFDLVELEISDLVDTNTMAFECWGYYWDRQVLNTPGGPRHPGSS